MMTFSLADDRQKIFKKDRALSFLFIYGPLALCKKTEKTGKRFQRYLGPSYVQTRIFRNMAPMSVYTLLALIYF